ncbi:hypothetical protein FRACA_2470006 [Frankia canadensis]|uniref:Uncharacterized protein n=1 Tax=Frankia canadensis TaxID=1836972 RepID=A0A2I2KRW6_9ACTN|nr:hypothetical protein FRACA_2470006 [Frankia canadensis]SOU55701.1 hypothetical protein FRACA_2470006 [Frankia canadensis]
MRSTSPTSGAFPVPVPPSRPRPVSRARAGRRRGTLPTDPARTVFLDGSAPGWHACLMGCGRTTRHGALLPPFYGDRARSPRCR